jgi:hypothetical protein
VSRRYFKISLSEEIEIHVFFETISGLIINFMVKLVLELENTYHEVVRFDSGHNCPHKDILNTQKV